MNVTEIVQELVKIKSYPCNNGENGEENLALFIESFLDKHCTGLSVKRQSVKGSRYNLIVTDNFPTRLIFCCHMDTVAPNDGQIVNDEVVIKVENDKFFGLGGVDMKGGTAAMLYALATRTEQTKGLALVFYCDEEFDFLGMKKLIQEMKMDAQLAVFCEPTNLKIANGCRGLIEFTGDIIGKTAHASRPEEGLNAITSAVQAYNKFSSIMELYYHADLGKSTSNLAYINGGTIKDDRDKGYYIASVGNNIPDFASVKIEVRTAVTELRADKAIKVYEAEIERLGAKFKLSDVVHNYGSLFTERDKLLNLEQAIKNSGFSLEYLQIENVGYYDAEMFSSAFNIPAVSFGPGPFEQSHKADEFVFISSLEKTSIVYSKLMDIFF